MAKCPARKRKAPKRVLALPDLEHAKSAVLTSLTSANGKRTYDHAITEFVGGYCSEPHLAFNRPVDPDHGAARARVEPVAPAKLADRQAPRRHGDDDALGVSHPPHRGDP